MNSIQELWSHVFDMMNSKKTFSDYSFNVWIKDLKIIDLTGQYIFIQVENDFKLNIIANKYASFISDCVENVLGFDIPLVLISSECPGGDVKKAAADFESNPKKAPWICAVSPDGSHLTKANTDMGGFFSDREEQPESDNPETPEVLSSAGERISFPVPEEELEKREVSGGVDGMGVFLGYSPEFSFDNFIVGNTNRFAYAACKSVASDPANRYNPLFIWGPSGLGKTHLLCAITNEIIRSKKGTRVLYVRGEDFTNQLVETLATREPMHYFREKYRNVDVLLVDDIQFIAGKPSTQEEFFHTFNALHQQHKQIILTSDCPPKEIKTLEDRLKSRFEWGLITDVQPPDLERRIAILKRKCEDTGLILGTDVLNYIADQIKDNIRQLEGAVKKLQAYVSSVNNVNIDLNLTKVLMRDIISGTEPTSVTVERIFENASREFDVPVEDIKSKSRKKETVTARSAVIYLLSKVVVMSSPNIGHMFNQDHSSVLYAIKSAETKIKTDPAFASKIDRINAGLKK